MAKYFITTPIYYVNAKPHIGHMYTLIAADVLARHHRAKGDTVLFSTGVDENSQKNVEAAQKQGMQAKAYVDHMASVWKGMFDKLGCTYDTFIRTTSLEHERAVQAMIAAIKTAGDMYMGDYEGYYCVGCEEFIAKKDLVDGKCTVHKTEPKVIKEQNYFFRLSKYRDQLLAWYESNSNVVQPASARNKMLAYIKDEMEDISISRQSQEWGIRFPSDQNHAVYVWFDALINYLTVTGYPNTGYEKTWPADLHLIGKDIIKFHCAIWPAMLMSANLPLPNNIFAHGFFTINGEKISKSLGNAIDPQDLLKEYPLDIIRYYLLREIPFGNDGDFSTDRLKERYNSELANGIGNLVSRTLTLVEKNCPDITCTPKKLPTIAQHIESLSFDRALTDIWHEIALLDGVIDAKKPWELAKAGKNDELQVVLSEVLSGIAGIAQALAPLLPETSVKIQELLVARPIKKPAEPLFARKD